MLNKASVTSVLPGPDTSTEGAALQEDKFVATDAEFQLNPSTVRVLALSMSHWRLIVQTNDMRVARALASEITTIGLRLYELLKKEEVNQKARQDAINLLYNVSAPK